MRPKHDPEVESRVQDAIVFMEDNPNAPVRTVAKDFNISRGKLRSRLNGHFGPNQESSFNTKLTAQEEKGLCRYIDRLDRINLQVRREFIVDAANAILAERVGKNGTPPSLGQHWVDRFIVRNSYFKMKQSTRDKLRQDAENPKVILEWYNMLEDVIKESGVVFQDIFNMDETGFLLGKGKDQLCITRKKRAQYFGLPVNRESATVIEAISAAGYAIAPFIILCGVVHMAKWYSEATGSLDPDTSISATPTGYTNDEISLEWIKHFDRLTKDRVVGKKRLLIIDGHGSHHTKEFIGYCDEHDIIPFGLPPHLTHRMQPLDVVCFQPLKHYHAKAIDLVVRDGCTSLDKLEFLRMIEGVRIQAFKKSTIQSAFKKTGIVPICSRVVLEQISPPQAEEWIPQDHQLASSPFSTPVTLRQVNKVTDNILTQLDDYDLGEELDDDIRRILRSAQTNTTELIQAKRDLGRTQLARDIRQAEKSKKDAKSRLQTGGVLTVDDGRAMVVQKEELEIEKARKKVLRADNKRERDQKKREVATRKAEKERQKELDRENSNKRRRANTSGAAYTDQTDGFGVFSI